MLRLQKQRDVRRFDRVALRRRSRRNALRFDERRVPRLVDLARMSTSFRVQILLRVFVLQRGRDEAALRYLRLFVLACSGERCVSAFR